jgi:hypothetical protein
MKKLLPIALATAIIASAALGSGPASAATLFGSPCAANKVLEGAIWVSISHEGPFPATAPTSGVITEWLVNTHIEAEAEDPLASEFPRIHQQRLLVLRKEGANVFKVVGEASGGPLNREGTNTYLTRLPVQQGDYIGLAGNPYAAYCETKSTADIFASSVGGTPVGSTFAFEEHPGLQAPVVARIEPDVDGDGYGDETQDQCPQSAAYQTPCPTVQVSSLALNGAKAVSVYVTSSQVAPVSVTGTVKLGKGKTATLAAAATTVTPGTLARYQLTLTKPVLQAMKSLSTKKALGMTISASATNVAGAVSTATSTLKLPGQKKPVHHKATHHKKKHHKPAHHKPTHPGTKK